MYEAAFSLPGRKFVVALSGVVFLPLNSQRVEPRERTRKAGYGVTDDVAAISWGSIPQF